MGAAENKQSISNMFAELSKGNGDAFLNALADDVSFTIIGSTKYSGTFKGKQELINKLLAPLNDQSTIAKFIGRNGPGIQQMAYRVTDIEATCERLREKGLRLLYDVPRRGTADSRVNFVHPKDAGGVLIELVEPAGSPSH